MATAPFRSIVPPFPILLIPGACPLPSVRNITSGWISLVESLRKTESERRSKRENILKINPSGIYINEKGVFMTQILFLSAECVRSCLLCIRRIRIRNHRVKQNLSWFFHFPSKVRDFHSRQMRKWCTGVGTASSHHAVKIVAFM